MSYIETILCSKGEVILLEEHLHRLKWSLYQNGAVGVNEIVSNVQLVILKQIMQDDNYYKIRLVINLEGEGFDVKAERISIKRPNFGRYKLGWYEEELKPIGPPWNAKSSQRKFYKEADSWAAEHGLDDVIILNENGHVVETTIFNLFVLKNNVLYTPPLFDMPVQGAMRTWLLRNSIFPIVEKVMTKEDVIHSELILLTNAIRGIQIGIF